MGATCDKMCSCGQGSMTFEFESNNQILYYILRAIYAESNFIEISRKFALISLIHRNDHIIDTLYTK